MLALIFYSLYLLSCQRYFLFSIKIIFHFLPKPICSIPRRVQLEGAKTPGRSDRFSAFQAAPPIKRSFKNPILLPYVNYFSFSAALACCTIRPAYLFFIMRAWTVSIFTPNWSACIAFCSRKTRTITGTVYTFCHCLNLNNYLVTVLN